MEGGSNFLLRHTMYKRSLKATQPGNLPISGTVTCRRPANHKRSILNFVGFEIGIIKNNMIGLQDL